MVKQMIYINIFIYSAFLPMIASAPAHTYNGTLALISPVDGTIEFCLMVSAIVALITWQIAQVAQRGRKLRTARDELKRCVAERTAQLAEANETLRESEEMLRKILESSPDAITVTDMNGKITGCNQATMELYGFSTREQMIGLSAFDFIAPQDQEKAMANMQNTLKEDSVRDVEYTCLRKDGSEFTAQLSASVIEYAFDKPNAFVAVTKDITARKKAEEAYRAVVENSLQGLIILQDNHIVFANPAAAEMSGYNIKELTSEATKGTLGKFIYAADLDRVKRLLNQRLAGKRVPARNEFRIVKKDGEVRWIEEFTSQIEYDGKPAVQTAFVDITERKQAGDDLVRSNILLHEALDKLKTTQDQVIQQERLRALGQLASGIAHDFNNALMPLMGYSELLLNVPNILEDKEKTRDYLKLINIAARDAKNVVKLLRQFYRAREEDEALIPVDLNKLVEESIQLTQPKWKDQAQAGNVTIEIETDIQEIPTINGNEAELREVLTNMIFNAVDAMSTDGTIYISTKTDAEFVILELRDTGVGMDKEIMQHCFDPFYSTKGEDGTGLGLAMVYGIIHRYGGSIQIESEVGKGTTFIVRFPMAEQNDERDIQESSEPPMRLLNVLVVDDEPIVRDIVTEYLAADGHTYKIATKGQEGLKIFGNGNFDLVITDRAMPSMNGMKLAASIKDIEPNTPVIMLTGFGDMMQATDEMPEGVDWVISKPITLQKFREALAQIIHSASRA